MKKIYQKPTTITLTVSSEKSLLAGSGEETGVVGPGQGEGKTDSGDDYIVLSKEHNCWNTWDEDEEDDY